MELHENELELTRTALKSSEGSTMLLDGGSGKKVLVPAKLSSFLRPSIDIDIIMRHSEALNAFAGITEDRMIDRSKYVSVDGKLSSELITYYSPFPVYRSNGYKDMDVFTERSGIGPVPITNEVFSSSIEVDLRYSGIKISVPEIAFVIATSINPLVFTETRARSVFIALFSQLQVFDPEDVAKRTAHYLSQSIPVVEDQVRLAVSGFNVRAMHVTKEQNYKRYGEMLRRKIPNKLDMLKPKIKKIMSKVDVMPQKVEYGMQAFRDMLERLK